MTWRTVHEHIVAETFLSNKSSSVLLDHEQQVPQLSKIKIKLENDAIFILIQDITHRAIILVCYNV